MPRSLATRPAAYRSAQTASVAAGTLVALLEKRGLCQIATVQARLENGEQLAVRLDGGHQQTLNGNAVARRQAGGGDLQFSLQFNDGNRIDETWSRAADGRTLQVTERWQPGFLQHPVVFRRVYPRVD